MATAGTPPREGRLLMRQGHLHRDASCRPRPATWQPNREDPFFRGGGRHPRHHRCRRRRDTGTTNPGRRKNAQRRLLKATVVHVRLHTAENVAILTLVVPTPWQHHCFLTERQIAAHLVGEGVGAFNVGTIPERVVQLDLERRHPSLEVSHVVQDLHYQLFTLPLNPQPHAVEQLGGQLFLGLELDSTKHQRQHHREKLVDVFVGVPDDEVEHVRSVELVLAHQVSEKTVPL